VRTRHRAPVQQGSRAAACLLGLPGERSHRPSTAAGAAAEGLARSHRRPPLHVRMPGLMAICLYGMTLTAHTRRLCLPRATPRPTRGGLHRRVCIFTAISQGPPTYHAWICTMHHMYGGSQPDSERTHPHPPSKGKLPCTLHVAPTHSAKCGKLRLYRSSELLGRRDAINQIESSLRRRTERRVSHKQLSTDSSTVVTYSPPQNISIIF